MNVRVIVTIVLLLVFPSSTAAQTPPPRLDLTRLNHLSPTATPTPAPFTVPVPTVRQNQFARPAVPIMSCDASAAMGRAHGDEKPFGKWFALGLGGGFGTTFFSLAWVPALARGKTRGPEVVPANVDGGCYTAAYLKNARRNSTAAAVLGSILGAVLFHSFFTGWS